MSENPQRQAVTRKRRMAWLSSLMMTAALVIGCGPGLLLVNTPEPTLGWPTLFVWGVVWYFVEVGAVLVAYRYVWDAGDES